MLVWYADLIMIIYAELRFRFDSLHTILSEMYADILHKEKSGKPSRL